ncbi:uncharacterized protein LOC106647104 [Copidosoma floridanum]|uniref:uncharacterized protein LOC106647104 n=1 Tax=Copidosoma floridanum TaxID=29053 RepID=UPI0006C942C3|nr:uncharacterized protein LOC106647104 [Copidosoma floridanum]
MTPKLWLFNYLVTAIMVCQSQAERTDPSVRISLLPNSDQLAQPFQMDMMNRFNQFAEVPQYFMHPMMMYPYDFNKRFLQNRRAAQSGEIAEDKDTEAQKSVEKSEIDQKTTDLTNETEKVTTKNETKKQKTTGKMKEKLVNYQTKAVTSLKNLGNKTHQGPKSKGNSKLYLKKEKDAEAAKKPHSNETSTAGPPKSDTAGQEKLEEKMDGSKKKTSDGERVASSRHKEPDHDASMEEVLEEFRRVLGPAHIKKFSEFIKVPSNDTHNKIILAIASNSNETADLKEPKDKS